MKAVIFDLDGVLVRTDDLQYRAWKHLTDREGIPFDRTLNNRLRGISRRASLNVILESAHRTCSEEQAAEMMAYKNDYYLGLLDQLTPADLLPHVPELLQALRAMGVHTAVGTSSRNAQQTLQRIGLSESFDAVVDGNEITRAKPDPEVYLKAAEKLGERPENCLVVEDAAAGIEAAKRGGMTAVGVSDARKAALTDYRAEDILEIIDLLRK
ncbi:MULTISPECIES: beta-phosphoglucomutase [Caproicibacterium]|jgi:beta-phosphoglucomutase|uniref:Beta-phosphoglucomutase n=1 Tax=Caproicibacterium lactatifermentans TaxID=2666138 RepID=A0A859DNM8_9FIRM|nr:beta-phosphoglucomutase [Caproicibacterium lactatifermentans]ARP49472.1 beta-phosphoglucomutase [Ruminococcaceae bacterium CPB6]MDD4808039.1 beta-phosphoglucomutase [Oscillospiraceae bacterium]QKN23065.1 beta-phosphoglucomutase [Caproicibacterium lactatifermentans]QKO30329.1 beta-phosphoglucomutase [Caproicibacterium lactatifermentans]